MWPCSGSTPTNADLRFLFGQSGGIPVLGDLDGDGRADPRYRDGSRWVCLVWNQIIGTHAISWTFGSGTDPGALGDVDGDGRADACVFRGGRFLCDTAHNGGAAELTLDLRSVLAGFDGGTPLLGDLDGDGRADPCVYTHGRLLCGIFPPGSRRPARTVALAFGTATDVPVLGNIDGF